MMTLKQIVQHRTATGLKHMVLAGVAMSLWQNHVLLKEDWHTLVQFTGSNAFHSAIVAVVGIFSVVVNGLKNETPTQVITQQSWPLMTGSGYTSPPTVTFVPGVSATITSNTPPPEPPAASAAVKP